MPHTVVASETIKNLEQQIDNISRAIAMAKDFASGGKEALKQAVSIIQSKAEGFGRQKDEAIEVGQSLSQVALLRGQEKAYRFMLAVFNDPKARVNDLIQTRKDLQKQLDEYNKLEKR